MRMSSIYSCAPCWCLAVYVSTDYEYHSTISMKRHRVLLGLLLLVSLAPPLYAYRIALKDGRVVHFEKYRVNEEELFYIGDDGKETAIPLNNIDVDRTRQLNAQEPVPLDLPGMATSSSKQNQNTEPSLGEIARKTKKDEKGATTKRVFTDDDVMHSINLPPTNTVGPS